MSSPEEQIAAILSKLSEYVRRAVEPLEQRLAETDSALAAARAEIDALKARQPEKGDAGEDADMAAIEASVERMVKEAVEALPKAAPGKDADAAAVLELALPVIRRDLDEGIAGMRANLDAAIGSLDGKAKAFATEAAAALPKPENGKNADPEAVLEASKTVLLALLGDRLAETEKELTSALVDVRAAAAAMRSDLETRARGLAAEVAGAIAAIPIVKNGRNGDPGRDAAQIEVLPAIDETRSYVRGTYSRHRGGLWRAFETTHEMRGWECIVEGIADGTIVQADDLRTFHAEHVLSSGKSIKGSFVMPVVIYRDVWQAKAYAMGDAVTRDGCTWIAVGDPAETDVPGTSKMWRMSVKKGRDGKDGANVRIPATDPVKL